MILVIDTSSSNVTVSIVDNNKIVYNFSKKVDNDIASKILPIIDNGFKEANLDIKSVEKILVVNGPGSFTGIRIGVTVAKTIGWALNINVVPISSLELMATTESNKDYIVPLIDARRGNVYAGIYDKDLNVVMEDKLVSLDEIKEQDNSDCYFVSYDMLPIDTEKPVIDVLKVVNKHMNDEGISAHSLKPKYLKLTEAEENRLKND